MGARQGRGPHPAACRLCGRTTGPVSAGLGFCAACLTEHGDRIREDLAGVHAAARRPFGLPPRPPRDQGGLVCDRCLNLCRIGPGRFGYCGLRKNQAGRLNGGDEDTGRVSWYLDPLPTNCVADWVCAGGTGAGHPRFAGRDGPQRGEFNLAVFYEACSFDCLFCQNWTFKQSTNRPGTVSAAELAAAVTPLASCICFFGGDPSPQVVHSLETSRLARQARGEKILRVCWETNGSVAPRYLDEMIDLALESGGTIKFDLKAFSGHLHRALTGARNQRTLKNFARVAARLDERPDPPLLVAATLLVPGYVDAAEVGRIARFIAGIDPDIPYALLAFHPEFRMTDLPTTSRRHAREALAAARAAGLRRVRIGNQHLLGRDA